MGKLLNSLNYQLKTEHKNDAEECLKIYNYLKETTGHVWESQWNNLVATSFIGKYPNRKKIFKPNSIGKIFLEGLNKQLINS